MQDSTKYFYVKFKIDTQIDKMSGLLVSEDKTRIDAWQANEEEEQNIEGFAVFGGNQHFRDIATNFPKSIEVFRRTVPFIMQNLPLLQSFYDDNLLRKFVKANGELISDGEFETYRLSIDHVGELSRRLENAVAIGTGMKDLPGMFLVGLISAYDVFLAQIIRAMFVVQPGLLSSSDRNISLKALMEVGSIDVARDRIIEKEVESVLRLSHADQVAWLETKLNIPLKKDLKVWPEFIELCERRNLLTHTGGIISSQYLDVCKLHGTDIEGRTVGQQISIDPKYYRDAVHVVLEMGCKLVQVIWRKLVPSDIQAADEQLNRFCYGLLVRRMYKLAATMLQFGLFEMKKHGSEAIRRMMVIKYANAEKLARNKELAGKILDGEDWTASTDQFRICVAAVKDELDTVIGMMKSVVGAKLVSLQQFREWPVFEPIRPEAKFVEAFEREFGEKLLADKGVANLQTSRVAQGADLEIDDPEERAANSESSNGSTLH